MLVQSIETHWNKHNEVGRLAFALQKTLSECETDGILHDFFSFSYFPPYSFCTLKMKKKCKYDFIHTSVNSVKTEQIFCCLLWDPFPYSNFTEKLISFTRKELVHSRNTLIGTTESWVHLIGTLLSYITVRREKETKKKKSKLYHQTTFRVAFSLL